VFARDLVSRAVLRPGVRSAALVSDLPLDGGRQGFGAIRTPGLRRGDSEEVAADWNVVSPGYFKTLDLKLVRGRDFTDADKAGAPRVAIVNEAFAQRVWGTADAIGRAVELNDDPSGTWQQATIVGVTADAHVVWLDQRVEPYIYVPLAQRFVPRVALVVKSAGGTTIPQMRTLIRELNPNLPVSQAMPMSDVTAVNTIPQRIAAGVAGSLGVICLLLAAIGIYGVTSYSVNRRVREIGIRVALGADGSSVLRLMLRQAIVLTLVGVAIGLALAAAASVALASLLVGVTRVDPITFGSGATLFIVVALAASYLPARRATRVDPMIALRAE
jgi:putative ABC transport system permease protein